MTAIFCVQEWQYSGARQQNFAGAGLWGLLYVTILNLYIS
jgi:hypothetical protein